MDTTALLNMLVPPNHPDGHGLLKSQYINSGSLHAHKERLWSKFFNTAMPIFRQDKTDKEQA
jgi:hypothetical protein